MWRVFTAVPKDYVVVLAAACFRLGSPGGSVVARCKSIEHPKTARSVTEARAVHDLVLEVLKSIEFCNTE